MLHAFNIYPALLVLTPVTHDKRASAGNQKEESEWTSEDDRYFTSCPQTYWGNCLFNDNHTQLMFSSRNDTEACPVHEKLGGKLTVLEPVKFKGKHFTITYIPVLN